MADEQGGGVGLLGVAAIEASFRKVMSENGYGESREERRARRKMQAIRQIPLAPPNIPITAGAGAIAMPDLLMAKNGFNWSIRRMVAGGFSAGTVIVWKNAVITAGVVTAGEELFPFPSAGVNTFGRGEMLLGERDSLVFSASGITLNAGVAGIQLNGAADCFETWLLADYLL